MTPPGSAVGGGDTTPLAPVVAPPERRSQAHPGSPGSAVASRRTLRSSPTAQEQNTDAVSQLASRAGAELENGDYPAAEDLADRCLALAPDNEACQEVRLRSLIGAGNHVAARPLLGPCLERNPDDVHCLSGMIAAHLSRRQVEEASALVAHLAAIDPTSGRTHFAQANLLEAQGKHDEAVPHYAVACTQGQQAACRLAGD